MKSSTTGGFRLTIRARIFLGFIAFSMVLALVGAAGLWSIHLSSTFFNSFQKLNEQADILVDVDRKTKDIQRRAIQFMNSGRRASGSNALTYMAELGTTLDVIIGSDDVDPDLITTLERVRSHLEVYQSTFRRAMQERILNDKLIRSELPELSTQLEEVLQRVMRDHPGKHPLVPFFEAQGSLTSYFLELDSRYVQRAFAQLDDLRDKITALPRAEGSLPQKDLDQALAYLSEYRLKASRAVQATRAYLYLINVVMAGEAAEIIYKAENLRRSGEVQRADLRDSLSNVADNMSLSILAVTLLTLGGGFLYTFLVSSQLTQPLVRLTRTFGDLSRDVDVAEIPGTDRQDEIGALAKSATVFHQRNQQTRKLLHETERLAKDLKDKSDALEASNAEMEQFVYTVSHDLKSPVVTSMGFIRMIRDLAREGRWEEAFSKLDRLEHAGERMGKLINDLLDLSRVGRVEEEATLISSDKALHQLKDFLAPRLQAADLELRLEGPFPDIRISESRFMEIFENLVTNAIKYSPSPENTHKHIQISCARADDPGFWEFRVRDFGPGIPEDYRDKVFDLFKQLDPSREGSGVGLTITRKLVHLNRGRIEVASPEGEGALFLVQFPVPDRPVARS